MERRRFLKIVGGAAGAPLMGLPDVGLAAARESDTEFQSVLVDITRCTGCRKCEEACAEVNDLPVPDINDKSVFAERRSMTTTQWTVVNRYMTDKGEFFVKKQCMHCNQPGCAAACLVQAMYKTPEGPVQWRGSKCMGCRYCMISCPFDVPKFEYDSPNPKIHKCIFCTQRLAKGQIPACVEGCPVEALNFGTRRELIEVARSRIYRNPARYIPEIYGEHEVGGTGWLYLSAVPFEQLGFRTQLGRESCPELTQNFLYSVPIILLLWPAFLYGASRTRPAEHNHEPGEQR